MELESSLEKVRSIFQEIFHKQRKTVRNNLFLTVTSLLMAENCQLPQIARQMGKLNDQSLKTNETEIAQIPRFLWVQCWRYTLASPYFYGFPAPKRAKSYQWRTANPAYHRLHHAYRQVPDPVSCHPVRWKSDPRGGRCSWGALIQLYGSRFRIEKMFQDQKSSGFDYEKSKIEKYMRFKRLLFCIYVAQVLMLFIGDYVEDNCDEIIKKYHLHTSLISAFSK